MRYFMAHVLQFQFHEAMCRAAGHQGPLHTCSVYGSEEAGARLAAMLSRGASTPWQDTLEQLTGTRQMDARPLLNYFEPLSKYLDEQNQGRTCGW
jgi:peptidyl-dipeptidase A